jgi:uncharacterized caspase-like protein
MPRFFITIFSLAILSGCSLLEVEQGGGKKYALVYGISRYQNISGELDHAADDASGMSNVLLQSGYEVILRTDSTATWQAVYSDVIEMVSKLTKQDVFLFYFAGHGLKENFLPYDADLINSENIINEDEFAGWISAFKTGKIVLLFDHCFSGCNISKNSDCFIITASAEDETSWEFGDPINHGIFTYYFIKGLINKKADSTTDGVITLSELYYYVNERVIDFTTNNSNPQHPQFLGDMDVEIVIVD